MAAKAGGGGRSGPRAPRFPSWGKGGAATAPGKVRRDHSWNSGREQGPQFARRVIGEHADLGVLQTPMRGQTAELRGQGPVIRQHLDQTPRRKIPGHLVKRAVGDAMPAKRPIAQHIAVIRVEPPLQAQLAGAIPGLEHPEIFRTARIAQQQAVMPRQIVRPLRHPRARQVIGRRDQHARAIRDLAPFQRRIRGLAQKEGQVDRILDDVDVAVRQAQPDLDAGIVGAEARDQRRDQTPPQPQGRGQPDHALRLARKAADQRLGLVQRVDDAPRMVIEGAPDLGRRQLARGAVQQPQPEAIFKILDAIGGNCRGKPQIPASGGDRAQFDHPDEDAQAFQIGHEIGPLSTFRVKSSMPRAISRPQVRA